MSFAYLNVRYQTFPIPSCPGWIADSMGVVWIIGERFRPVRRYLRAGRYDHVAYGGGKRPKTLRYHRLVCEAFHGPPPFEGALARHLNDVKSDNRPGNLAWGTHADNADDEARNWGSPRRSLKRTFGLDVYDRIMALILEDKRTYPEIANLIGCSRNTVERAKRKLRPDLVRKRGLGRTRAV